MVSKSFQIPYGEVRGQWEPIVSPVEFERGVEILRQHDAQKSRHRKQFYLLRNILWANWDGKTYKMYGTTPTGRSKSYSYYATQVKLRDRNLHLPCDVVDSQIPDWLQGISINPELLPKIRETYTTQVQQTTQDNREEKVDDLKRKIVLLREEEARLGRLLVTGRLTEDTYDKLRLEWQEKLRNAEINLVEMERETKTYLDDLEVALVLLSRAFDLFGRLNQNNQSIFLRILAKRIIVDLEGKIVDYELNSPFVYLKTLADAFGAPGEEGCGSDHVQQRLLEKALKGAFFRFYL